MFSQPPLRPVLLHGNTPYHKIMFTNSVFMPQSADLSSTCWRTQARPSEWYRPNPDSSTNITKDQSWWFQFMCLHTHMRRRWPWSGVNPENLAGCFARYPYASKRISKVPTQKGHQVHLIKSILSVNDERNWPPLMCGLFSCDSWAAF